MCDNCPTQTNFLEGIDPDDVPDGADVAELQMAADAYNAALYGRCCQLFTTAWMSGVVSAAMSNGVERDVALEYGRTAVRRMVNDPLGRLSIEEGVRLFMEGKQLTDSAFVVSGEDES